MTIRNDVTYTVPLRGARVECHVTLYRDRRLTTRGAERIIRKLDTPDAIVTRIETATWQS